MPTSLAVAAEKAQDQYYQDYPDRDDFFDLDDFKFHFAAVYSKMFDAFFQQVRKANKGEDGFSNVEMSAAWLVKEEIPVESDEEGYFASPSSCIYGFGFDEFSYSLDNVRAIGGCPGNETCKLQKISLEEAKYLDITPPSRLVYYWLAAANKIRFQNALTKVAVVYVPAVEADNDNCVVSDNIVADVIKETLILLFGAKSGNVVDESNDGNKNTTQQNQSNPQLTKIQAQ